MTISDTLTAVDGLLRRSGTATLPGVGEKWPRIKGKRLHAIMRKHCGAPERQTGSHCHYWSPITKRRVTVAFSASEEIPGNQVARILVTEVGLSPEEARKEAR